MKVERFLKMMAAVIIILAAFAACDKENPDNPTIDPKPNDTIPGDTIKPKPKPFQKTIRNLYFELDIGQGSYHKFAAVFQQIKDSVDLYGPLIENQAYDSIIINIRAQYLGAIMTVQSVNMAEFLVAVVANNRFPDGTPVWTSIPAYVGFDVENWLYKLIIMYDPNSEMWTVRNIDEVGSGIEIPYDPVYIRKLIEAMLAYYSAIGSDNQGYDINNQFPDGLPAPRTRTLTGF